MKIGDAQVDVSLDLGDARLEWPGGWMQCSGLDEQQMLVFLQAADKITGLPVSRRVAESDLAFDPKETDDEGDGRRGEGDPRSRPAP